MLNLQDYIAAHPGFKKFSIDELLLVEYQCPLEEGEMEVWWHNNFFEFVLSGSITLKTLTAEYTLNPGDCVFARKGSVIAGSRDRQESFCELLVFLPDDFIRSVIHRHRLPAATAAPSKSDTIIPISPDDSLKLYFHSLLAYLHQPEPPSETLIRLKLEELIVHIVSGNNFIPVKNYFAELSVATRPSIRDIMEENFVRNLSLEEYARLCARSLSGFKEEFKQIFNTSPGKWLQERRLQYGHFLLVNTDKSIDAICAVSGFENVSHFIRVFKNKFGASPGKFRISHKTI
jgi:AraC family transcriptional regulator, exoenzyme S synthesis regulatory protein ExsA